MTIHYLQHVPFEGLASFAPFLADRGHNLSRTRLFADETLPVLEDFDALIVMGGPMNVDEESRYPWLTAEKALIGAAIDAGKPVLGVCLGAQLIAQSLGAAVTLGPHREIGWFPVTRHPALDGTPWQQVFPSRFDAFHWHGDQFELPPRTLPLGRSEACAQQGFIFGDLVVALQFHLETTPESARALIDHAGGELDDSPYVQSPEAMLTASVRFEKLNALGRRVLSTWLSS